MNDTLANPLLISLSSGRVAIIKWSFDWYPKGFAHYEARYKKIDWEALSDGAAYDLSNPDMRIERPGKIEKVLILKGAYQRRATALEPTDLAALNEARALVEAQIDYARLCEIYC